METRLNGNPKNVTSVNAAKKLREGVETRLNGNPKNDSSVNAARS